MNGAAHGLARNLRRINRLLSYRAPQEQRSDDRRCFPRPHFSTNNLSPPSKAETPHLHPRATSGTRAAAPYLRSKRWSVYFDQCLTLPCSSGRTVSFPESLWTVPLFRCPFCSSRRLTEDTASDEAVRCVQWRTPLNMMNHLSYSHMQEGWDSQSLLPYNEYVLSLMRRRIGCEGSRRAVESTKGLLLPPKPEECSGSSVASSSQLRLLVWLDVANIDFGTSEVLLDVLHNPAFRSLLQHVPIGWCCTHELFVPHTCATLHGALHLRCRHPHSELFLFYVPTRMESGDLGTSRFISAVREAAGQESPPMVLVTKDAVQRICTNELFGNGDGAGVITSQAVSCNALYHAILQALGDGIG